MAGLWPAVSMSAAGDEQAFPEGAPASAPRILIVHDQAEDPQLGRELSALLGHFFALSDIVEQANYQPGSVQNYDATFYVGGTHKAVNPEFLKDVYYSEKPVVWMGRGLEWLAAGQLLSPRYGIEFERVSDSGRLTSVDYKNTTLAKTNPITTIVGVKDESKAEVVCWATGGDERAPYIVRSGNFWFFADVPMAGTTRENVYSVAGAAEDTTYLILADLLHDILNQQHPERHDALLRIEDVHPKTDLSRLNSMVEYLHQNGIPFGLGLVPVYKNPDTGEEVHLSDRPDFVAAIKNAQAKGATIILHGYTHQRVGETVVDYEFWDRDRHAPPADETPQQVRERLEAGLRETHAEGIYPSIWETPHYAGSDLVNQIVATEFGVVWERREAPFFPYPVRLQETYQLVLPETLGYVNPMEGNDANRLLAFSDAQQVVRDGYAAGFIHTIIDQKEMRKLVNGLQDRGYSFVSPSVVAGLPYTPAEPPTWWGHASWSFLESFKNMIGDITTDASLMVLIAIFVSMYYWGIFLLSRKPKEVKGEINPDLEFVIVVPCLNEELVIGKTLDSLLALTWSNLRILVVDDASEDRTREIALSYKDDRLSLLDHPRDEQHQGKGRVLNFAYRQLMASDWVKKKGPDNVIIGVIDADGRVDKDLIEKVNPYFDDPQAGAVQIGVRISNSQTNILTKWQNFEFLTFARIAQKAREYLGSVGLGGNGQFVRLSALSSLGDAPWTDCLTEDLDLGIRMMLIGWQNHYCPKTFVAQQGVPELRPLINQRTRWFQGHTTCWRHIPALLTREGPVLARTDTVYYLLAPMLVFLFLPATIMFVFWSVYFLVTGASNLLDDPFQYIPVVLVWYLFSFGALPTVVWTFWREEKDMSASRAFLWAHIFSFFYAIWFVAGCKAVYRLARGQGSWAKTARTEEMP